MKIHSARERGWRASHFRRIDTIVSVGCCPSSATSNRKSSRSSLADSSRILATSDVETESFRPAEITFFERSRNSLRESEMRIDSVCCCGLRSIRDHVGTFVMQFQWCNLLYRYKIYGMIDVDSEASNVRRTVCRGAGNGDRRADQPSDSRHNGAAVNRLLSVKEAAHSHREDRASPPAPHSSARNRGRAQGPACAPRPE